MGSISGRAALLAIEIIPSFFVVFGNVEFINLKYMKKNKEKI